MKVFLEAKWWQRTGSILLLVAIFSVAGACGKFELVSITPTSTTLGDPTEMEDYPGFETPEVLETTTTTLRPARYTVEPGDSLSSIGAKFGVSIHALAGANNLPNADAVAAGDVLVIPDPLATVTPPWVLNGIDHAGRDR